MPRNPQLWESAGDLAAIARALRHCGRSRASTNGQSLHGHLIKIGLSQITFLANSLISMYADLGSLAGVQALFDEMPHRNVASWTASMDAHSSLGSPCGALNVFSLMLSSSEDSPNSFTLSAALKASAITGDLLLGRQIHARILLSDLVSDSVLMNSLLDFYVRSGNLEHARKVFDEIPIPTTSSSNVMMNAFFNGGRGEEAEKIFSDLLNPDAVSFNTVVAGFSKIDGPKALEFLRRMHRSGHPLDRFSFPCALKICGGLRFGRFGRQIHGCVIKSGIKSSHCGSSLIQMYSGCFEIEDAEKVFGEFLDSRNLLAISNSMISGFASNGLCGSALRLVSWIHGRGFVLDAYSLSAAARACAELQDRRLGQQIHGMIAVNGLLSDPAVGTLLMEIYTRSGNLDQAMEVFDQLPGKDAIAWGSLIAGCVDLGSNQLGFRLFKEMMIGESEASPDEFILSSVLRSRAGAADLGGGRQIHAIAAKLGFSGEEATATSLVDLYSKCGEVDDAIAIFGDSRWRDTASWTAIIAGCAVNGRSREALGFLREMKKQGVETNDLTFTGALAACRHGGLLEEACEIFKSTAPSLEHRHLMLDILCRGGRFREARELFDGMRETEDAWNVLIGGVRGEDDIRTLVGRHVMPRATSAHVTLSNALAGSGRWYDSALVREAARRRGIRKEPGFSRIEIKL